MELAHSWTTHSTFRLVGAPARPTRRSTMTLHSRFPVFRRVFTRGVFVPLGRSGVRAGRTDTGMASTSRRATRTSPRPGGVPAAPRPPPTRPTVRVFVEPQGIFPDAAGLSAPPCCRFFARGSCPPSSQRPVPGVLEALEAPGGGVRGCGMVRVGTQVDKLTFQNWGHSEGACTLKVLEWRISCGEYCQY